ncbi:hypothetical protein IT568_06740 [bacterium]|nr:hypothetical protein [bacterium]
MKNIWEKLGNAGQFVLAFFVVLVTSYFLVLKIKLPEVFFFDTETPELKLIDALGIITGYLAQVLTLSLAFLGWLKKDSIRNWFRKNTFENTGEEFNFNTDKAEVVVSAVSSGNTDQIQWMINFLKPKAVALLYTEQSKVKFDELTKKEKEFEGTVFYENNKLIDAFNTKEIKETAKDLLEELVSKFPKDKIIVDLTSGTVPISVGLFQAAEEMQISTTYVIGKGTKEENGKTVTGRLISSDKNSGNPIFINEY